MSCRNCLKISAVVKSADAERELDGIGVVYCERVGRAARRGDPCGQSVGRGVDFYSSAAESSVSVFALALTRAVLTAPVYGDVVFRGVSLAQIS